jgi:hypothetical protein
MTQQMSDSELAALRLMLGAAHSAMNQGALGEVVAILDQAAFLARLALSDKIAMPAVG